MAKNGEITRKRAQKILFYDKLGSPATFKNTLKLEVYSILNNFMEINLEDIKLNIVANKNGNYQIEIFAETNRIKPVGFVLQ